MKWGIARPIQKKRKNAKNGILDQCKVVAVCLAIFLQKFAPPTIRHFNNQTLNYHVNYIPSERNNTDKKEKKQANQKLETDYHHRRLGANGPQYGGT